MKKLLFSLILISSSLFAVDKPIIAPTGSVVIKGNSTVKMQTYNTGAWQDRLTILNDGKVGVGKTPSTTLDVNGTITGNGSGLTSLNGSNIASGTVSASYLPIAGAAASGIVDIGTQTFAGTKTFSSKITGSISGNCDGNAGTVTNGVYTSGDQTIGGTKTFSGAISFPITSLSNAQATAMGYKQYLHGTAYNGGQSPTVGGTNVSTVPRAVFIPYQMQDSTWRMRFNIAVTSATVSSLIVTVNGITSKSVGGFYQAISCGAGANTALQQQLIDPGTTNFACYLGSATSVFVYSGDIELNGKPTWAY